MDNAKRAWYGHNAVRHGTPDYGLNGHDEEGARTDVIDTLANLMHYCGQQDLDFGLCVDSAKTHFEAEVLERGI